MNVGVLALQGAFGAHVERLRALGVEATEVRTPQQLERVDALVMPGGESTTMSNLLGSTELFDPIADRLDGGMPVFGTCAGMILLADKILDGRDDQRHFGVLDVTVRRNGYGRQIDSFETDARPRRGDPAVPRRVHPGSTRRSGRARCRGPVVTTTAIRCSCARDHLLAACFHPELTDDVRLHARFVDLIKEG